MEIEQLQKFHKQLLTYRKAYYVDSKSLIDDEHYDALETIYKIGCDMYQIPEAERVTSYVGYSEDIPKSLVY